MIGQIFLGTTLWICGHGDSDGLKDFTANTPALASERKMFSVFFDCISAYHAPVGNNKTD